MLPLDKQLHFLVGALLASLAYPFGYIASIVTVVLIAFGKEAWDATGRGTPDIWDAIVTIIGGAVILIWFNLTGI